MKNKWKLQPHFSVNQQQILNVVQEQWMVSSSESTSPVEHVVLKQDVMHQVDRSVMLSE